MVNSKGRPVILLKSSLYISSLLLKNEIIITVTGSREKKTKYIKYIIFGDIADNSGSFL